MRTLMATSLSVALSVSTVLAQPLNEADITIEPEPEIEIPAAPEPPPMPKATDDFTADRDLFMEVETAPEKARELEVARQQELARSSLPLYQQMPGLAFATEAAAGVFSAGAIGLFGGAIGGAINSGDKTLPLGGFHGPVIGGLVGSMVGATVGVWGGAQLFEKNLNWGWTALGVGVGTVVSGSIAFGVVEGLNNDAGESLGVGLLLLSQVASGIGVSEIFLVEDYTPQSIKLNAPPDIDQPSSAIVPIFQRRF